MSMKIIDSINFLRIFGNDAKKSTVCIFLNQNYMSQNVKKVLKSLKTNCSEGWDFYNPSKTFESKDITFAQV